VSSSLHVRAGGLLMVAAMATACGSSSAPTKAATPGGAPSSAVAPSGASASSAPTAALSGSITVFAAASLTKAFTELGKQFQASHPGTTVKFSFGASSALAQQILAGAPADVFASASKKNMKQVTDNGDAVGAKTFALNVAEIAVAPGSAGKVTSLADLGKSGVKVALCQVQVPCGALAQQVLAKAKVTVQPATQGLDVKSTLAYVTSGEVDAAVVYVTDVQAAGAKVKGIEIPKADNASTAYPIAAVKNSKNAALAAAFEALVLSPAGQDALSRAGFRAP
jgi:molybdate transport system substrate-binding protein